MKKDKAPLTLKKQSVETIPLNGQTVDQALRRRRIDSVVKGSKRVGHAILFSPVTAVRAIDAGIGRAQRLVARTLDTDLDE